jgi:type VI secretion system protein ImpF
MSYPNPEQGLMPSFIDRLIDPESGGTRGRKWYTIEEVEATVLRDLEDLLNTRQTHTGLPPDFKELHKSIYAYGLPDLTSLNAVTPAQREEICRIIEETVATFEPRLKDARAFIMGNNDGNDRTIRFRIEARLNVEPAPAVAFETELELTTGHYRVNAAHT